MRTLFLTMIFTLAISPVWSDNTVGGEDMPWEGNEEGEEVETAIVAPKAPEAQQSSTGNPSACHLYDLQGRKVVNPQPGNIYICRGKKIVWTKQ